MTQLELFLTFFKIGLFTFGGGYAMIAVIEDLCVEKKRWITHEDMMNITVLAESTPGPVAINLATFVGYKRSGFRGALMATFGVVLPSFMLIYAISMFLENFLEITVIANAFRGIKIAVGILIVNAAVNMIRKMKKKPFPLTVLMICCLLVLLGSVLGHDVSSVFLILLSGAAGLAFRPKGGDMA